MQEPVIELIAENVLDAVNSVKTANGYFQSLTAKRPKKQDFSDYSPADGIVLVVQSDPVEVESSASGTRQWRVAFVCEAMVIDSDFDQPPVDTRMNRIASDLTKALLADHTRGGLAIDTTAMATTKFDDGAGSVGIACPFEVHYRHKIDDPTVVM